MSPVTGLARLPGRILWCVHMGNFSPVDQDEFKKHNQNGGTYIDYFIESTLYGFLFTPCKTLENSLVRCAHSFVFQSLATRK